MDAAVERIFLFRHGDYGADGRTKKQTLARGYENAARSLIESLKRRLDLSKSIGFGSGPSERHKLSALYVASQITPNVSELDIISQDMGGSRPDIACRDILTLINDKPRCQYIICGSEEDIGHLGIPYELLNTLGLSSKKMLNGSYPTINWYGVHINLRTGEFEQLP